MGTWKRVLLSPNYTEERTSWSISEIIQRERTLRAELAGNRDTWTACVTCLLRHGLPVSPAYFAMDCLLQQLTLPWTAWVTSWLPEIVLWSPVTRFLSPMTVPWLPVACVGIQHGELSQLVNQAAIRSLFTTTQGTKKKIQNIQNSEIKKILLPLSNVWKHIFGSSANSKICIIHICILSHCVV